MKQLLIVCVIFLLVGAGCNNRPLAINNSPMQLSSRAFENNSPIPSKYTCDGENISPPLAWNLLPAGTKSLALVVDDPDAPNGDWVHWTLWDIVDTGLIEEGTAPPHAIQGLTSFNTLGYGGPCPPSGTHHYHFKLYALDTVLGLYPAKTKKDLEAAMQGHILDQAELVGLYVRNR